MTDAAVRVVLLLLSPWRIKVVNIFIGRVNVLRTQHMMLMWSCNFSFWNHRNCTASRCDVIIYRNVGKEPADTSGSGKPACSFAGLNGISDSRLLPKHTFCLVAYLCYVFRTAHYTIWAHVLRSISYTTWEATDERFVFSITIMFLYFFPDCSSVKLNKYILMQGDVRN